MAFRGLNEDCYVAGSIQGEMSKRRTQQETSMTHRGIPLTTS